MWYNGLVNQKWCLGEHTISTTEKEKVAMKLPVLHLAPKFGHVTLCDRRVPNIVYRIGSWVTTTKGENVLKCKRCESMPLVTRLLNGV